MNELGLLGAALVWVALSMSCNQAGSEISAAGEPLVEQASAEGSTMDKPAVLPAKREKEASGVVGAAKVSASDPPAAGAALRAGIPEVKGHSLGGSGSVGKEKVLVDTGTHELVVQVPAVVSAGQGSVAKLRVKPKPGWKLNREFPTALTIESPIGVALDNPRQKLADAINFSEKKGATWAIHFTAANAGKKQFAGKIKFAVCTDATCDPKSEKLAFAVSVE